MTEWKTYRLGEIVATNKKSIGRSYPFSMIKYLDTGSITRNHIESLQEYKLSEAPSRAKRLVQEGDIIYSAVRPNQLHYGYISKFPENLVVSTGFIVISCNKDYIEPKFLYYLLTQQEMTDYLHSIADASTSAYPSLKSSDIENLEISLPGLEEQRRIAGILGAIDDKIENNRRINTNLELQAQALFDEWFVANPSNLGAYSKAYLTDIANYLNGLAMQRYRPLEGEIGIPVLKIKELGQGQCDSSSDLCSPSIEEKYIVRDGDIIFSWSGTLLVDIWCGGVCGLNQHLFKVTSDKYPQWFIYYWTKHHLAKFIRIAKDKAVTMGHIKRGDLEASEVLIPNETTLNKMDSVIATIFDAIISHRIENRTLATLRDTLLPKLMNGEIKI